jgi:hypothetical protein
MSMEQKQPAGIGPVERGVRPCAWWYWSAGGVRRVYCEDGKPAQKTPGAEPLYDKAALDAAVAAERERILSRCQGKTHDGCAYLGRCGMVCNKCGQVA